MSEHGTVRAEENTQLYEVAYLISSLVPEEKAPAVMLPLKDLLASNNVIVVAEEVPRFRRLEYPLRARLAGSLSRGKSKPLDAAFFGWIRFGADAKIATAVTTLLASTPDIIRFRIFKVDAREPTTRAFQNRASRGAAHTGKRPAFEAPKTMISKEASASGVSLEELDRKIEEMVGA